MGVNKDQARPTGRGGKVLPRSWVTIAVVVALVALAGFAVWGRRSSSSDSRASGAKLEVAGSSGAAVGKAAPRFSVTTLAGSTFTVPAGKPAAVWFTADGCRSCIPKAKALDKIKGDAGDRIAILGVDINPTDTESDFRGWIKEVGDPRFDFAMDKNGALVLAWGVRETSTVVIVDAAGKVVYHSTGVADEATFRAAFATAGLG